MGLLKNMNTIFWFVIYCIESIIVMTWYLVQTVCL